jgi:general secretion pathway protein D
MRKLFAATLVAPVLVLAQVESPAPAPPQPAPPPRGPASLRAGMPAQPPPQSPGIQPPATRPPMGASRSAAPTPPGRKTAPATRSGAATTIVDSKCVPLQGRFLLAFNKADIVDVLEQASRWTCRNFAYTEETARGKITLLSKTPVTAEEAYAAFLAALTANGIAIYPSG